MIDDDPSVSESLCMLLEDEYDTHAAGTVEEGVRLFDALHPNLVILDLHLPDNHGLKALRSIRQLDRSAPVVILTGYATLEVVEESMRLGAADCLHKPFDGRALRRRLKDLLVDGGRRSFSQQAELSDEALEEEASLAEARDLASSAFLHDVTNPVTSLFALTSLLEDVTDGDERSARVAGLIRETVQYLSSLVDQWRAFTDPETLLEDFSTSGVIAERAMELVRLRAEARKVTVNLEARDPGCCPRINRHAAVRVLTNLLQNAIEAVEPESGLVTFRARRRGEVVEFIVQDNGRGIAPADTQKIFQPHFTTKKKGTGLGLYIARHILESAGGAISICSRPGRGTCFTVQLPVC